MRTKSGSFDGESDRTDSPPSPVTTASIGKRTGKKIRNNPGSPFLTKGIEFFREGMAALSFAYLLCLAPTERPLFFRVPRRECAHSLRRAGKKGEGGEAVSFNVGNIHSAVDECRVGGRGGRRSRRCSSTPSSPSVAPCLLLVSFRVDEVRP
mmetsp:Transcript_8800/g.26355  ORF Transcript_8800/g.26355 Transcript_8800/m.26355 type:complete len:152 (-) Transcript_8800:103-558(-)